MATDCQAANSTDSNGMPFATGIFEKLNANGYVLIENLFDETEIGALQKECQRLVGEVDVDEHHGKGSVFTTGKQQTIDEYFLQSAQRISFFYEKNAFNDEGKLIVSKEVCLNKIGHALHEHSGPFRRFTFHAKIIALAKQVGLVDPVVVQSMIIFKNPLIGGEVCAHQDASYLHTLPFANPGVIGFWVPLEDATVSVCVGQINVAPINYVHRITDRFCLFTKGREWMLGICAWLAPIRAFAHSMGA